MAHLLEKEGRQREYKDFLNSYGKLHQTVVAFSNDIGGDIIIGVSDSGKVVGLTEGLVDKYLEELARSIYDAVSPACLPKIGTRILDGKTLVELNVHQGSKKPYFIKSQGVPDGVYIRVGAHNKVASKDILEELLLSGKRVEFDDTPVSEASIDDLDPLVLKGFYGKSYSQKQLLADKVLVFNALARQMELSVCGLVYFHKNPREYIQGCEILLTIFAGNTTEKIVKTVDISGPLPTLLAQVEAFLSPYLQLNYQKTGMKLKSSEWEISYEALREALINALIHRKYTIKSGVKIAVFENRVEIFSPGNFPGPITADEYKAGLTYPRNESIRQLARKAGIVEKRGLGLKLIIESKLPNTPTPEIIEGSDYVKVILYRKTALLDISVAAKFPEELRGLLPLLSKKTEFQTSDVCRVLHVSANTARIRVQKLVELDLVEVMGQGRASKFIVKGPL